MLPAREAPRWRRNAAAVMSSDRLGARRGSTSACNLQRAHLPVHVQHDRAHHQRTGRVRLPWGGEPAMPAARTMMRRPDGHHPM